MPNLRSRRAFEITRGVRAFLNLEVGVTGSAPPESSRSENPVENRSIQPGNIVWIFGHGRSGTTWLMRMLQEPEGHVSWAEPWVGALFGLPYYRDAIEA